MAGAEEKQSEWQVQTWEDGGWVDYWPVTIYGSSRRRAVKRAGNVFQGEFKRLYLAGKLRWRVGRMLRDGIGVGNPAHSAAQACNVCGGSHSPEVHR